MDNMHSITGPLLRCAREYMSTGGTTSGRRAEPSVHNTEDFDFIHGTNGVLYTQALCIPVTRGVKPTKRQRVHQVNSGQSETH
jgi:hypothetical protein